MHTYVCEGDLHKSNWGILTLAPRLKLWVDNRQGIPDLAGPKKCVKLTPLLGWGEERTPAARQELFLP